jgi:hypothetical protein
MHARARSIIGKNQSSSIRGQLVTATVDGKETLEYEGLRGGELAWVLGRRMVQRGDGVYAMARDGDRPLHMSASALGEGVNRMQRLASTRWMEAMFANRFQDSATNPIADRTIDLATLELTKASCKMLDSELNAHQALLYGSTALYSLGLSAVLLNAAVKQAMGNVPPSNRDVLAKYGATMISSVGLMDQVSGHRELFSGGLDVLQTGPFLCGAELSHLSQGFEASEMAVSGFENCTSLVEFTEPVEGKQNAKRVVAMPIDVGDVHAQSALEAEMRIMDMMDWTPDGLILSKLASPAGDTLAQEELDAQSAQLFNVAVQGPALSTVWTSDLNDQKGDHRLACQPMDKVFVCIVATLAYSVSSADPGLVSAEKEFAGLIEGGTEKDVEFDLEKIKEAGKALIEARKAMADNGAPNVVLPDAGAEERQQRLKKALEGWDAYDGGLDRAKEAVTAWMNAYDGRVAAARLSGFRLMRTTSSHMANFSKFDPSRTRDGVNHTRLGLPLEPPREDDRGDGYTGVGEYIIGGWCVGTVIDSAASRSVSHNQINTAPASMAMNVNVNIEWWSAGKLHKHYMDNRVLARGGVKPKQKRPRTELNRYGYAGPAYGGYAAPYTGKPYKRREASEGDGEEY